jgi:mannan polymerase II complex MNN10 subunit
MTAAVYIYYTPEWQELADIVLPKGWAYCKKHEFEDRFSKIATERWAYLKMICLSNLLLEYRYDFIWVLDLDTLITNPEIKFTDFTDNEHDIFICKDINGINAGSWIIRNTEASRKFIETIVNNFTEPHEQILMNKYLHMVKVKYLPHPSINSYKYELYNELLDLEDEEMIISHEDGNWQPGDLLLHLPGLSLEKRIEVFKEMI